MNVLKRLWIIGMLMVVCAGCNLSKSEVAALPTDAPAVTEEGTPSVTRTPIAFGVGVTQLPTLLP